MRKRFFLNIFLMSVFVFMSYSLIAADDICEPPPPEPGSPGNDNADERYSYSSFSKGILNYEGIGSLYILDTVNSRLAEKLLKKYCNNICFVDIGGSIKPDFLIIPTGALFSVENDTTLKHVLEQYVNAGGTIIVFAQQYGSHVENVVPIPEGESLKVYGWREDQRV